MITYRLATLADNQKLLDLTSSTGMSGKIALRIDRNPDFFGLIKMRGESKVFIAIENEAIIGSICVSKEQIFVGQKKYPLYYISDFKVDHAHRNKGIGLELTNKVTEYLETVAADLAFLNVSKGNARPFVFFSNRQHYPDFENIGQFNIYQFIGAQTKNPNGEYKIDSTSVSDETIEFLNAYYATYELASVITKDKLEETTIFSVRQGNKLRAVMCLADTMKVKQNVALKLPWYFKYSLQLINTCNNLLGVSKMPRENEPILMLYIKYLAIDDFDKHLVAALLKKAKNMAYKKSYSFVSLGLHEKDPLIKCFSGFIKLTFSSVGMLVSMKNNTELMNQVKEGIPFKDYSIV